MNEKHSPLGVTSFFMGVICGLLATFFLFSHAIVSCFSMVMIDKHNLMSIFFFVFLCGNALACLLGITSLFQKEKRRLYGLMGTVFSVGMLFLNIGLYIIIDANF